MVCESVCVYVSVCVPEYFAAYGLKTSGSIVVLPRKSLQHEIQQYHARIFWTESVRKLSQGQGREREKEREKN